MTVAYLALAACGLPVALFGLRSDRAGRTGTDRLTALVRGAGSAALFGGLAGFALSLLEFHWAAVAVAATLVAGGAAYLRIQLVTLSGGASPGPPNGIEGG